MLDRSFKHQETVQQQNISTFDIQKNIGKLIAFWPYYMLALLFAGLFAMLYLRYTTPTYNIRAKVYIQDGQSGSVSPEGELLAALGFNSKSNVENEIEVLKTRTLMEKVVEDLQLNINYYTEGRVKMIERYKDVPFRFDFLQLNNDSFVSLQAFKVTLDEDRFTIRQDDHLWQGNLGDTLYLSIGTLVITPNYQAKKMSGEKYVVTIDQFDRTVNQYMSALNISSPNKKGSILEISISHTVPGKGEAFLNKLIDVYLKDNVEAKNRIADVSMSFIDTRLGIVGEELSDIEKEIEGFKRDNKLADLSEQSKLLLNITRESQKEQTSQEVQVQVIESLEKYMHDSKSDNRAIPVSLLVENEVLSGLTAKYNELQLRRERLLMSSTEANPAVQNVESQIANLRADIKNALYSAKSELQVSIAQLKRNSGGIDAQLQQVPSKERVYLEYSRQQSIKQELFLFLLKKKEETAITKSSTIANARVLDVAKSDLSPYKPKRQLVFLSAFVFAIIIPTVLISIRELLNTRVSQKTDITNITSLPILGEISHEKEQNSIVVGKNSKTVIAEQFRTLRTNIQFLLSGEQRKVIMITSSMSGEGKSFVSTNLSIILAMSGKKVVLMELDLRKPKISKQLNISNQTGFSNYTIGQAGISDIICPSGVHENLFVVPSGPISPAPAELILLPAVEDLFRQLREQFDYVIIDTAPIGLVTDAQLIAKFADASLFIVRQEFTFKQQINALEEINRQNKLPRLGIVVNDVVKDSVYGNYGYGYGRGYGYGYAYGEEHTEESDRPAGFTKFKKVKQLFRSGSNA